MAGLNQRELRFVELILSEVPAGTAYTEAGYKAKTRNVADAGASRLLRSVKVSEAIRAAQEKALEKLDITAEKVIGWLVVEARLKGEGSSHSARVRALELLGKRLRLFDGDAPPEGKNELVIKVLGGEASMSDLLPKPQLT